MSHSFVKYFKPNRFLSIWMFY